MKSIGYSIYGSIVGENGKERESLLERISELLGVGLIERNDFQPVIFISSSGGDLDMAIASHAFLKLLKCPLTTIALGKVHSAAIFPFLAGKERLAVPTARFMVHGSTWSLRGVSHLELMSNTKGCILTERTAQEIIASETGQSIRTVRRWQTEQKNFSSEEALRFGLVHRIVDNLDGFDLINLQSL